MMLPIRDGSLLKLNSLDGLVGGKTTQCRKAGVKKVREMLEILSSYNV